MRPVCTGFDTHRTLSELMRETACDRQIGWISVRVEPRAIMVSDSQILAFQIRLPQPAAGPSELILETNALGLGD